MIYEIYEILQRLKKSGSVCVPTDKTNSTMVIQIKDYKCWISDHLSKAADLELRAKVVALFENANVLLDKVKMGLSVQEENFVRQSLATKATPYPKLLIKDHKKINDKGEFPTRLVIPATNFTTILSKISYLGIKRCLEKVKVKYSHFSIVQASDLKEILEEKKLVREEVTIESVDAINMYPSIKLTTIKKAARFFARTITTATKKNINICLELIRFGMSSTMIFFDGEYYEYHGVKK